LGPFRLQDFTVKVFREMRSPEEFGSSVSVQQLNAELELAQLELLSAHCATHQLRLHYTTSDLVRFGRQEVLRKSAETASAINQFYESIEKSTPQLERHPAPAPPTPERIVQAIGWLATYLRQQRDHYFPVAGRLSPQHEAMIRPYFSPALLEQIRIIELQGARVTIPEFFSQVRAAGFEPPEVSHMESLTFIDVVVFNQHLTLRALFHALVHCVQIQMLGVEGYSQRWVESFVDNRTHFTVPLEVHAFSLASRFLSPLAERFSVEEQVLRWRDDGRY
jgi:hypothetical protein